MASHILFRLVALFIAVLCFFALPGLSQSTSSCQNPSSLHQGGYIRHDAKNKRVIIFVNGIFGDSITTWLNSSSQKYWPTMLCQDHEFDSNDIYVFSFDSPRIKEAQNIEELASRLGEFLTSDEVIQTHPEIIFICHSMGGLITRQYLVNTRLSPKQVPMIFFFATPTMGANIVAIARHLSANPQLRDMLPLSDKEDGYIFQLIKSWIATSSSPELDYSKLIWSFCAYEKYDTFGVVRVVEEQSAIYLCNREFNGILADHISIVKPTDERDETYIDFKSAYNQKFGMLSLVAASTALKSPPAGTDGFQFKVSGRNYARKTVKKNLSVACGSKITQDLYVAFPALAPGESIIGVKSTIENTGGLKSSSVALVKYDVKGATIHYSVQGADSNSDDPCLWSAKPQIVVEILIDRSG